MIELCDTDKLESEQYKKINKELGEVLGQIDTVTKRTLVPGDHYCFDYAFIVSRIKTFKDLWFLDLGSGLSPLSVYIALQGGNVVAIDIYDHSDAYRQISEGLGIPLSFSKADFCSDPLPKADVIVSCSAMEHNPYERISELMKNVDRSLDKGGQFIFTVVAEPTPRVYEHPHWHYNEERIRSLLLNGFELEKNSSNFDEFESLYAKFRKMFPHYFYMPVGISLIKK